MSSRPCELSGESSRPCELSGEQLSYDLSSNCPDDIYLDFSKKIDISESGNLPHWHQAGKVQFITFRLVDSLPAQVIGELRATIEEFNKIHPKPWSTEVKRLYWNTVGPVEESLLDKGHGSCLLKDKIVRDPLSDAILHYDGGEWNVMAYVIMPNHVHLLVQLIGEKPLDKLMKSVKMYAANRINKTIGRRGSLWQKESFDRLVRNHEELKHYIIYIVNTHSKVGRSLIQKWATRERMQS